MSKEAEIQELLDLYLTRKNAQGGEVQFSALQLFSLSDDHCLIDIQGIYEGRDYTNSQKEILARRLFPELSFRADQNGFIKVQGQAHQIKEQLQGAVDNVALYPHTEIFESILNKVGLFQSEDQHAERPIFLSYPLNGKMLSEFEYCRMRGFHVHSPGLIDTSMPPRGVVIQMPYSRYDDSSRKASSAVVFALHAIGFELPLTDYAINDIERNVFGEKVRREFPDNYVPVDGRVGYTTLASYEGGALRLMIMEDEATVLAKLEEFAQKPAIFNTAKKLSQPESKTPSFTP